MKFTVDESILKLIDGPVYWFVDATASAELIREKVPANLRGVYCLWWKDPKRLPRAPRIELDAGRRGKQTRELKVHFHGLSDHAAMYVGKGAIRTRLASHIKPSAKTSRNPYWWMTQIAKDVETIATIKTHLGFSFIDEPSTYEQVYLENLAIGILRPWFNLRCTA
jgi:hypothetical protein